MQPSDPIDRRRFLTRGLRKPRIAHLSCERLYVRYVDAVSTDRVADFIRYVTQLCSGADDVQLTEREWLARDDFREALETALRTSRATMTDIA